jgi:hypothetical protein
MKNFDIVKKIPKLPVPEIYGGDIRIVLTLATVIATTHMVNRIEKVAKELDKMDHPDAPVIFK